MSKQDPRQDPKAAALLENKAALAGLLESPEARTLAGLFQQMGGQGLMAAAQAAARGDGAALSAIVEKVRADPEGAKAMEAIDRKAGR